MDRVASIVIFAVFCIAKGFPEEHPVDLERREPNEILSCPSNPFKEGRRWLINFSGRRRRDVLDENANETGSSLSGYYLPFHTAVDYQEIKFDFQVDRGGKKKIALSASGTIVENRRTENWSKFWWKWEGYSHCTIEQIREFNKTYNTRYNVFTNNCQVYTTKLMSFLKSCKCPNSEIT